MITAVFGLLLTIAQPTPAQPGTLREALAQIDVPTAGLDVGDLDMHVKGVSSSDDKGRLTMAFYRGEASDDHLPDRLDVIAFDRATRRWHHARLAPRGGRGLGSILDIRNERGLTWILLHNNPSASTTLVLSPALVLRATLDGELVGRAGDLLVYERSEIHFAPTHPFEVAVYDLASGRDQQLYPRKPYQPLRQAYVERVRAIYAEVQRQTPNWAAEHNHHLDPELFDSRREGPIAVDARTRQVTFRVIFGDPQAQPATPAEAVEVSCDVTKLPAEACRERRP